MSEKKEYFEDLFPKSNASEESAEFEELEEESDFECFEQTPLVDALFNDVMMHKLVHFDDQFPVMLEYYEKEGKGVHSQISKQNILDLYQYQEQSDQNLAALLLSEAELEKVMKAKECYQDLKKIYDSSTNKRFIPLLLADLIFSEEEEPQKEMQALIDEGEVAVPYLISLLQTPHFYDPLFPGYGQAPSHAIDCLGQIKSEAAIVPLFELLGKEGFAIEEAVIYGLKSIGQPSLDFLTKVLQNRPITKDNELAAIALTHFDKSESMANIALELLAEEDVFRHPTFAMHLIFLCQDLTGETYRKKFTDISQKENVPDILQPDFQFVISHFSHSKR